jgi:orotidine-5'-phosphate decarboxylase
MDLKKYVYCALDFSSLEKTLNFTQEISKEIGGVKLGLEFFLKYGIEGVKKIKKFGVPIFLDLKLNDIPNTVKKAVQNIINLNPEFLTVHISGGKNMLKELVKVKNKTKIIGVTLLTSLDKKDLKSFGINISESTFVEKLTKVGFESGVDGVVSSPLEVKQLRNKFGKKLIYITPGIRMANDNSNDQKRLSTPGKAISDGSSLLVIGRTITSSTNPINSINKIIANIRSEIESKN